ncbi:MAG: IclR family transcriptional regulator [Rhodoferax sp.]|nr:IclR family transcriptional regulator [Rhodoferax sp.]
MGKDLENQHGVQSLEIGISILKAISAGHRSMMLKDIAASAQMPASKVHRYMVSLMRSGLVEQDPLTSRYDLGPFALTLGLVAVDRLDRIGLGLSAIATLRDEINETTALAVWSDKGPVIIRSEGAHRPITVNVVTGTALNVLTSASGRIFAAWLPPENTLALIQEEMQGQGLPAALRSRQAFSLLLESIRKQGVAAVTDYHLVPGVAAVAAPVFNAKGEITLSVLAIGVKEMIDLSANGAVVAALKRSASGLSERLGYSPDMPLGSV